MEDLADSMLAAHQIGTVTMNSKMLEPPKSCRSVNVVLGFMPQGGTQELDPQPEKACTTRP